MSGGLPRFALPGAEYERISWLHNEHLHGSETPLIQEAGLSAPTLAADGLPRSIFVNGYGYDRDEAWDLSKMPAVAGRGAELEGWREKWAPKLAAVAAEFGTFDAASVGAGGWAEVIEAHATLLRSTFGPLHMETMAIALPAAHQFLARWDELFGIDGEMGDGRDLLLGYPNESTARVAALWRLSRIARADSQVGEAVRAGVVPGAESAAARRFGDEFGALIERYGHTTTMHLQDLPTWREDPSRPLAMVAAYLESGDEGDPALIEATTITRRKAGEARLRAAAQGRAELGELLALLEVARQLGPVSEDHNVLGDHRLLASSRARWLRVGRHLVERGQLAAADDLFYLRRDELVDLLEGRTAKPSAALIGERRALQAAWRAVAPPATLGAPRPNAGEHSAAIVRGTPASAGRYRGRARVVASLDGASVLREGDILVVSATGPEWAGYFGLIGALVTDVGGALTHGAVVAREFGIPAVVGTRTGTAIIPDGATVTVDGGAGVVAVEE